MNIRHLNSGTTANFMLGQRVQTLNDQLRVHGLGGRVVMSKGVATLDEEVRRGVVKAIRAFNAFNKDNDPHGEHDCAFVEV